MKKREVLKGEQMCCMSKLVIFAVSYCWPSPAGVMLQTRLIIGMRVGNSVQDLIQSGEPGIHTASLGYLVDKEGHCMMGQ